MEITTIQMLLAAIVVGIAGIDMFNGLTHFHRPVVLGPIIGMILGQPEIGIAVGATIELSLIGAAPLAGAQPPNVILAGFTAVFFSIIMGDKMTPEAAVAVSLPFAVLMQALITILFNLFTFFMPSVDDAAENLNFKKLTMVNITCLLILFFTYAGLAFSIMVLQNQATNLVEIIPQWLLNGLTVAGGLMPAMGIAILLNIMFKKEYISFLLIGFILSAFFNINIIALTGLVIAFAIYDYLNNEKLERLEATKGGDYEDGI